MARMLLFHLHSINWSSFSAPETISPFTKPGAAVYIVASGRGVLHLDDKQWQLQPGPSVWFYSTSQQRTFVPVGGEALRYKSFWFAGPGLENWLEALDVKARPQFDLQHPRHIHTVFDALLHLCATRPPDTEWRIHLLLESVLRTFMVARNLVNSSAAYIPPAIGRVLDAVQAAPQRAWTLIELAAIARMNPRTFVSSFRAAMNQSPYEYLQSVRLNLARELLADQNLQVKEIAYRLRFCDEHYFSHFFRKYTGMSPSQFRRLSARST